MTQGFCPFAHGCAQVHQTLRIGRHIGVFRRQQAFGKRPERVFKFFVLRIAVAGEHAAEYAFDVAVQNGFAAVEGKGANGGGGASAYAAEGFQVFALRRKRTAELFDDLLRGFVQIARAAVIAQTRPQRQHFVLRRGGKRLYGREFFQETRIVVQHGGNLRLLEHDFGKPDAIRVFDLPREVVPAVLFLPAEEPFGEGDGCVH
ncbi:hypothetical protein NEISICOT_02044 [Neisseria sicca ATCC 29256]|uniref:Uncharacterized protein n=1 Tax=Neisseria sicca ATCC 29256 TaxID=547045 RepID=C6M693_NEISI|nr:hypothetical protein NEISICOT_02044 [Neisseria sicca ATCC 29256]